MLAKGEKIHVASWPAFATPNFKNYHDAIDIRTRNHAFEGKVFAISATGIFRDEMREIMCKDDEART